MLEFLRRNQVLFASGLFLTLSFALLTANRGAVRRFDPLGVVFLEILEPLQGVTLTGLESIQGVWGRYLSLVGVARENESLKERLRLLEAERHRAAEIELQNQRLQLLLDFRTELAGEAIAARVVGRDASTLFHSFTLDRGQRDGLEPGMAVVCADGVVGRIAQVSPNASRVLLLINYNSGVDAIVQRTRARGIVEGVLEGGATMKYLRQTEDVEVGDVVMTSGLDGIFPKGVMIGRILQVERKDYGLFQVATILPAVDFSRLEEVLVITSPPAIEGETFRSAVEMEEEKAAKKDGAAEEAPVPPLREGAAR
jgi:rod shape-determining protein MreC